MEMRQRNQTGRKATRRTATAPGLPPRGFTLLELMIAIVVISVLAAFLLPAIQGITGTAKDSAVRNEISQMESAIATFKQKYGIDPPSAIRICEDETGWLPKDKAIIQRMWPNYSFATHDIDNDTNTTDVFDLDSTTSLVFFLGGVVTNTGTPGKPGAPQGFSRDPSNPFKLPTTGELRDGPYFEFTPQRVRKAPNLDVLTTDDFHFLQYFDPLGTTTNLYLYLSSNDGRGYVDSDIPGDVPIGTAYVAASGAGAAFHKPKSFQIISAGADGIYGNNKDETLDAGSVVYNTSESNNGLKTNTGAYDNITNFAPGRLKP